MIDFTQSVFVIGKKTNNEIQMLGTGFLVSNNGKIATARHVIGNEDKDLVVMLPHIANINEYQDTSDTSCKFTNASVEEINPITDLCLLKTDLRFSGILPAIESLDNIQVGDKIGIFGFPHCVMGRRVLTYQETEVGAKMLLETSGIKSKYATINIQTRPGQSGSLILIRGQELLLAY
ncbi:MAG: serine protease [Bacteroides sp.]|nr:serine protease [Bacteroides sp.]